jgi:hypothetical protein
MESRASRLWQVLLAITLLAGLWQGYGDWLLRGWHGK